ncbi:hypothetical protein ACWPKS_06770 [Coraliomargarita sp. W4R72]
MRNDLAAAGLLQTDYALMKENEDKYVGLCQESLTFKPFDGTPRQHEGGAVISVTTRASSILVFALN